MRMTSLLHGSFDMPGRPCEIVCCALPWLRWRSRGAWRERFLSRWEDFVEAAVHSSEQPLHMFTLRMSDNAVSDGDAEPCEQSQLAQLVVFARVPIGWGHSRADGTGMAPLATLR